MIESEFQRLLAKACERNPNPKRPSDPGPVEAYVFSPDRKPSWAPESFLARWPVEVQQ